MPRRKAEAPSAGTKAIRRRIAREDRQRRRKQVPDYDWDSLDIPYNAHQRAYKYCCSTKCERANGNAPLTYSGNGKYWQYRDKKGKLRWMFAFVKRSERDDMLKDCKKMNGCKARKEPNCE